MGNFLTSCKPVRFSRRTLEYISRAHKLLLFLHVCPVSQQAITDGLNQQDGRSDLISLFEELLEE